MMLIHKMSLCALAVSIVACGGKVIFSDGNAGGAGGATGTTHASVGTFNASVTNGVTVGKGSTSSGDKDECQAFCSVTANCQNGGNCIQQCQQLVATPNCQTQASNLIVCVINNFNTQTCSLNGCDQEEAQFSACSQSTQCQNGGCTGDAQSCECDGTCSGVQQVRAKCVLLPSPTCDCFVNDAMVGTCAQNGGNACDIQMGCCSEFWGPQPD